MQIKRHPQINLLFLQQHILKYSISIPFLVQLSFTLHSKFYIIINKINIDEYMLSNPVYYFDHYIIYH